MISHALMLLLPQVRRKGTLSKQIKLRGEDRMEGNSWNLRNEGCRIWFGLVAVAAAIHCSRRWFIYYFLLM